jgi:prepilin-type N-terminal cleavage/methylation domain-containing protein
MSIERLGRKQGTTLVELLVAMTIFLILMALLYPTFSFLQTKMSSIGDNEALSERGNRLLDYMAEKIRMTGFIIGSNPCISFCGEQLVNSLAVTGAAGFVDGNPYDTITFLTSFPIETDAAGIPYLRLTAAALRNANTVTVNTTNVSASYITPVAGNNNAKSLVTFDVLKPTYPYGVNQWNGTVYTVSAMAGSTLTFANDPLTGSVSENQLAQDINAQSYVYAVRRYQFTVNAATRTLQEVGWTAGCLTAGETFNLDESAGPGNAWGGVDALQFEYGILQADNTIAIQSTLTTDDLPNVRNVRISLLLRAAFPTRDYMNTNTYSSNDATSPDRIGNLPAMAFNDNYKRIVMRRVVDVRNMGLWRP